MTKASKMRLQISLALLLTAAIVFLIFTLQFRKKYSELLDDKKYDFTVQKIKKYRGYLYLNDSIQVPAYSLDSGTSKLELSSFLKIGDVFFKEAGKEEVTISRGEDTFYFINY